MTDYNSTALFSGLPFNLGNVSKSQQPSTLKQNLGKNMIEKRIAMKNATDIVLQVEGILVGLTAQQGESKATVIQTERDTLEALEDGDKHTWTDGKHAVDMVISPGSLRFEDAANIEQGNPQRFSMRLIQWQ